MSTLEQLHGEFPGFGVGALAQSMGIVLTEASAERVAATMPVLCVTVRVRRCSQGREPSGQRVAHRI